jgi:hypothetical protein
MNSQTDRRAVGVAKVLLKVTLEVTDSAHPLCALFVVSFIITYATCQELYFLAFVRLASGSAQFRTNGC